MKLMTKKCSKCEELKTIKNFRKDERNKDGLRSCCKRCDCKQVVKWAKDNFERKKRYMREWRKNNSNKIKESKRKYDEKRSKFNFR